MSGISSFGVSARTRMQALRAQYEQYKNHIHENSNISIELPTAITSLITGPDFWIIAKTNRYKKLVRKGHMQDLLELASIAQTKQYPAHWFAKVCSVKAWARTLNFLKKLYAVRERAERVATRLSETSAGMRRFIYKQIWAGKNVERHAATAWEIGEYKHKLFAYLCAREESGHAT